MIRLILVLVVLFGGFILVAMLIAPTQPYLRSWYLENACPFLDKLSIDICAAAKREAGPKRT
jgi:hypothetical protein